MSNKRWDTHDKIELMKFYALGKSYDEIGSILNRSPNAIKLRLEAIVYENLARGTKSSVLTRMLNTNEETIKQLYYSHKSFRESRNEPTIDVTFETNPTLIQQSGNKLIQNSGNKLIQNSGNNPIQYSGNNLIQHSSNNLKNNLMQNMQIRNNNINNLNNPNNLNNFNNRHSIISGANETTNILDGGSRINDNNIEKKLELIEKENHVLDEIIKNYRMKRQLRKLYVDGKLDKKSIIIYEKLLKQ
jgi:hypothetical protein